ncbi:MAG TPA: cytochrome b/b6 domain-containing protein [Verrucomicrobiae bacterium]|nr:cytochrome b/b6 domain-containing protein [Verrucomicrobiae bacterium]
MMPGASNTVRAALGLLLVVLAAGGHAAETIKDSDCLECHSDTTLTKTNAEGRAVSLFVNAAVLRASVHQTNTCQACHADITTKHPDDNVAAEKVNCARCHARQSESYTESVHGLALAAGDAAAPTCTDCHDSHELKPITDPASPLYFANLAKTCGNCHDQAAADVAASVHGQAVAAGKREAPTCIDCHSEHRIEQLKTNASLKISADVCSKCHASERINSKFNLPADRVKTFFESYHGLASQYGSTLAANCASCHGYHLVLPSSDPRSSINPKNLVATCGKCHPGATTKFASGKIHVAEVPPAEATDLGGKVNAWVRRIYVVLIIVTISVMLVHNGLLFLRKWIRLHRAERRTVQRMNRQQRWQHFILLTSFIVLAVTGFALKFPDSWLARLLGAHEDFRRWTHRVAGVIMLGLGLYHVSYLLFTRDGRRLLRDFLPEAKDARDVVANARYLTGTRPEKARFKRFGYAEKLEYWAVVWGTIIMGVTGLAIWFKMEVTQFLPRWVIDVATTIHYYEAILACLAILVWHFYHVMFDPDIYPVNLACWDGRVSEHWMEDEHPLATEPAADGVKPGSPASTTMPAKDAPASGQ